MQFLMDRNIIFLVLIVVNSLPGIEQNQKCHVQLFIVVSKLIIQVG